MKHVGVLVLALLSAVASHAAAQGATEELIRPGDIVVANLGDHTVSVFDGDSGAQRGLVAASDGGLRNPTGVAFGPDGSLYVGSSGDDRILRFDGRTGEYLDVFAAGPPLTRPFSLVFDPAGRLLVSSGPSVLKYARDGSPLGEAAGGMAQPIGLAVGRDGTLYVANSTEQSVERFDPDTGRHLGSFSRAPIAFPSDLAFGPDGSLYVSSASAHEVVRFDASGVHRAVLARLPDDGVPMGLAFRGSVLIIGDFARGRLFAVDPERPQSLRMITDGGLVRPENLAVRPAPVSRVRSDGPGAK